MSYKSTQRQVNIVVRKEQRGWWERLSLQERKPVFLAPDFDRWLDESDAEMEIREKVRLKFLLQWIFLMCNPVYWTAVLKNILIAYSTVQMTVLFKYPNQSCTVDAKLQRLNTNSFDYFTLQRRRKGTG